MIDRIVNTFMDESGINKNIKHMRIGVMVYIVILFLITFLAKKLIEYIILYVVSLLIFLIIAIFPYYRQYYCYTKKKSVRGFFKEYASLKKDDEIKILIQILKKEKIKRKIDYREIKQSICNRQSKRKISDMGFISLITALIEIVNFSLMIIGKEPIYNSIYPFALLLILTVFWFCYSRIKKLFELVSEKETIYFKLDDYLTEIIIHELYDRQEKTNENNN